MFVFQMYFTYIKKNRMTSFNNIKGSKRLRNLWAQIRALFNINFTKSFTYYVSPKGDGVGQI